MTPRGSNAAKFHIVAQNCSAMITTSVNVGLSFWGYKADQRISHGNTKRASHSRPSPRLEQGPYRRLEAINETKRYLGNQGKLELAENHRDLALFNMAIDYKLRGCDLVKMKVVDVMASGQTKERASVLQSKTPKPVRFEISEGTQASVEKWMEDELVVGSEYL